MPLRPPATIAQEILDDIDAIGVVPGTPVTDAQRKAIWVAVVTRIYTDLQSNAQVAAGSFSNSGGPVTGEGGPIV